MEISTLQIIARSFPFFPMLVVPVNWAGRGWIEFQTHRPLIACTTVIWFKLLGDLKKPGIILGGYAGIDSSRAW